MSALSSFAVRVTLGEYFGVSRALVSWMLFALVASLFFSGCDVDQTRSGIPAEAQAAITTITEDIAAGRYEKVYNEAAEEWRSGLLPEQNRAILERLRTRLGKVTSRSFLTGKEQQNTGGELPGHSLVVSYY